ncbi:VENN motif pre-toxin domain-containing protein [Citrobacter portucalensis]|uniref:VENN motif pre-toxin domain-containing protein n=1 Tax=Citrobacter portucalensis TaxID=1639133 RepID=UPI003908A2FF
MNRSKSKVVRAASAALCQKRTLSTLVSISSGIACGIVGGNTEGVANGSGSTELIS